MFLAKSEYDRGVNTFSPEGRLYQVEYAIEAIKLGSTGLGIQVNDGVVLAVEKRVTSKLLESSSIEKIVEVDNHIGCCMSGLTADARTLVDHARVEAQAHRFQFDEPIPTESCTLAVCELALQFGEDRRDRHKKAMSRPFGVALLLGGVDEHGPRLFHADPSGTFVQWKAKAIGAGTEGAQGMLKDAYKPDMSIDDAKLLCMKILKQVIEEEVTSNNVEVAVIRASTGRFERSELDELDELIAETNRLHDEAEAAAMQTE